jgi:hypothetical protein
MFNICVLADYKVKITTKLQYEEMVDYYCDIGAITKTRKETIRKQETMDGGKLLELIIDYLKDRDCFETIHRKDNELIITFYNPFGDTSWETTKIIKWEIKAKCKN